MGTPSDRQRQLTISLPPEIATEIQALAERDHLSVSELLLQAFRSYRLQRFDKFMREARAVAQQNTPGLNSEEDVERLVAEYRSHHDE